MSFLVRLLKNAGCVGKRDCYYPKNPYYKSTAYRSNKYGNVQSCNDSLNLTITVTRKYTTCTLVSIKQWKCVLHNLENHKRSHRAENQKENIRCWNRIPQTKSVKYKAHCLPEKRAKLTDLKNLKCSVETLYDKINNRTLYVYQGNIPELRSIFGWRETSLRIFKRAAQLPEHSIGFGFNIFFTIVPFSTLCDPVEHQKIFFVMIANVFGKVQIYFD